MVVSVCFIPNFTQPSSQFFCCSSKEKELQRGRSKALYSKKTASVMFCSCPLNRFPLFAPALLFTVLDNEFGRPPPPSFLCLGDGVGILIPFQLCIHVAQVRDKALQIRTMYRQVEIKHEIGCDDSAVLRGALKAWKRTRAEVGLWCFPLFYLRVLLFSKVFFSPCQMDYVHMSEVDVVFFGELATHEIPAFMLQSEQVYKWEYIIKSCAAQDRAPTWCHFFHSW